MIRRSWVGVLPASAFLAIFFVIPVMQLVWRSLSGADGPTFARYGTLLFDPYYLGVIAQTVSLGVGVTLICLIGGYPIAWLLARGPRRAQGVLIFLLISPLLTSIVMRTFGWRVLLARTGLANAALRGLGLIQRPVDLLNAPGAAVAGLVHVLVPFMVLAIATVLQGLDRRLEEAAAIHGATGWQVFRHVVLPLSLEGVLSGCLLVFMLTLGSFVTLLFLGGGSVQTLPLLIYQQFSTTQDFDLAAAMSSLLLVIAFFCLYAQLRVGRSAA